MASIIGKTFYQFDLRQTDTLFHTMALQMFEDNSHVSVLDLHETSFLQTQSILFFIWKFWQSLSYAHSLSCSPAPFFSVHQECHTQNDGQYSWCWHTVIKEGPSAPLSPLSASGSSDLLASLALVSRERILYLLSMESMS